MAQKDARGDALPAADFCPPAPDECEDDFIVLTPEMARLRFDLLIRKSAAWSENPWLRRAEGSN